MRLLVVDNYDSFTYNLVHLLESILHQKVDVRQNDQVSLDEAAHYERIILSPGPGLPEQAGNLLPIIQHLAAHKPMLGVCLGHQAIGVAFGAKLKNLAQVYHGVASALVIQDDDHFLFKGVDQRTLVGRYHSWVIDPSSLSEEFQIVATDEEGNIMAMQHHQYDLCSVQFHPESVMTPLGKRMLENWLSSYVEI